MSDDNWIVGWRQEEKRAKASQAWGWVVFLATMGTALVTESKSLPSIAIAIGVTWLALHYINFTVEKDFSGRRMCVGDAREGLLLIGLLLVGMTWADVLHELGRVKAEKRIERLCRGQLGTASQLCDEIRGTLDSARESTISDDSDYGLR